MVSNIVGVISNFCDFNFLNPSKSYQRSHKGRALDVLLFLSSCGHLVYICSVV